MHFYFCLENWVNRASVISISSYWRENPGSVKMLVNNTGWYLGELPTDNTKTTHVQYMDIRDFYCFVISVLSALSRVTDL